MGEVAQLKEQLRGMKEEELKAVNDLRALVIDMNSDTSDHIEIKQGELSQVQGKIRFRDRSDIAFGAWM